MEQSVAEKRRLQSNLERRTIKAVYGISFKVASDVRLDLT